MILLIIFGCGGGSSGTANTVTSSNADAQVVQVYMTLADQSKLLARQPDLVFGSNQSFPLTINIHDTIYYQQMDGFGASMTDSSAWVISHLLNATQKDALMQSLFDPINGIGVSWLRQPMGASDFSLFNYSYDDVSPGQTDPPLNNFSIAYDLSYRIPLVQQALLINPSLKITALPWSPPAWMKYTGTMNGGQVNFAYGASLAQYFVKYIQAYQSQGIPIYAVSSQNEPLNSNSHYPTALWSAAEEANFIGTYLGPALAGAGLSTKIIAFEHNWDLLAYPLELLGTDIVSNSYTSGTGWHCYGGDPSSQTRVHNAYPDKGIWFTECSGGSFSPNFANNLKYGIGTLMIGSIRNWAKAVALWNLALDQNSGPINGGCSTCRGVVTIDSSVTPAAIIYNVEYYILGHVAKFIIPGAYRIDSNTFGSTSIENVAFKNPDGSIVLLVLNSDSSANTFSVSWHGSNFSYTLPAGAVATFKW